MTYSWPSWYFFFVPWHWPIWLLFGVLALVVRCPLQWRNWIGRTIARILAKLFSRRVQVIRKNLELAFPKLSVQEREDLTKQCIDSAGLTLMDAATVWLRGVECVMDRITFNGLEHLEKIEKELKRGTVLIGAHFASLDLVGAALSSKFKFGVHYRKMHNPEAEFFSRRSRNRYFSMVVGARNMRDMVKCLNEGGIFWYASDQDIGSRGPVCFAPFFGIEVSTVSTPYRLIRKHGLNALFMSHTRNESENTWEVTLTPIEFADGDHPQCDQHDATVVNKMIEEVVRRAPAQYFWLHRRFKTLPDGTLRDYRSR